MLLLRNTSHLAWAALLVLLEPGLALSQSIPPDAPPGPPAPGSRSLLPEDITLRYPGDIYQAISASGAGKRGITLLWRYKPSAPGSVDVSTKEEHFATTFVPTAIAVVNPSMGSASSTLRLFVAGRGDRGHTIVEEWQFERTALTGPTVTQVVDSQSGLVSFKWKLPPRTLSKELLRDKLATHDTVMWMMPNHASHDSLFLQFWSSREVHSLSCTDGALTRVATPSPAGAGFSNPHLADQFTSYWAADRSGVGYVYVLGCSGWSTPLAVQSIVFVDSNRDGILDQCRDLSSVVWAQEGWKDSATYIQYFP